MSHDEGWRIAEYLPKLLFPIDKHTASTAAHKELNARTLRWVEPLDFFQVVVRGTKIEPIIHVALPFGQGIALLQKLESRRLRHNIRHIEHSRHTPSGSGPRLALHRGFVREARFSHVNMTVNDARKQEERLISLSFGEGWGEVCYPPILNANGRLKAFAFVHDCDILYGELVNHHRLTFKYGYKGTKKRAKRQMS